LAVNLNHRAAVGMLVAAVSALLAGCGQSGANGGGPATSRIATPTPGTSAAEILTKPAMSTMKDMHFTATIQTTSGGQTAQLTGEGDMVVHPSSAFRLKVEGTIGGATVSEEVITKSGTDYVREGAQKFKASPSSQASDVNMWQEATNTVLLGEEQLATGTAWHVRASSKQGNPFEAWIRKNDGYLLRYFGTSRSGNTTFTYSMDRFNTGVTIEAPAPGDVAG
jgi:outer membrane lipoprotein-sorting protein